MAVISSRHTLFAQWITDKYSNFIKGKVYKAEATGKNGYGYTSFRITDEDGDYYTLDQSRLGKDFIFV